MINFQLNDPSFSKIVDHRYDSFNQSKGRDFEEGKLQLPDLYEFALHTDSIPAISGKQERLENIINQNI